MPGAESFRWLPIALSIALMGLVRPAGAQSDAGTLLQQLPPRAPVVPAMRPGAVQVPADAAAARAAAAGVEPEADALVPVRVRRLVLRGHTLFDKATLHALVADAEGRLLTIVQLRALAQRITDHYRQAGYELSRAFVPAQAAAGGEVVLQIVEARYGRVQRQSRGPTPEGLLDATFDTLRSGEPVVLERLEEALARASAMPGIDASASLRAGEAVGLSDLDIAIVGRQGLEGQVTLDNHGSASTGRARASAALRWLQPLGRADVVDVDLLSSGRGLQHARLQLDLPVGARGTRAQIALAGLRYELGSRWTALQADGSARSLTLGLRHPLVSSADGRLEAGLRWEGRRLADRVGAASVNAERAIDSVTLALQGGRQDDLGATRAAVEIEGGRVRVLDLAAREVDAAAAGVHGRYGRVVVELARQQSLAPGWSGRAAITAQWSDGNLDPARKLAVGGAQSLRGRDSGAQSADRGVRALLELRHALAARWQAQAFVEAASLQPEARPVGEGRNRVNLADVGLGLTGQPASAWRLQLVVAAPLKRHPLQPDQPRRARAWVDVALSF